MKVKAKETKSMSSEKFRPEMEWVDIDSVTRYINNPRENDAAVDDVAASIKEFGWKQPIVVDYSGVIVVGDTRYMAARRLGEKEIPIIVAKDLSATQIKAYRIADNKVGEKSTWDIEKLSVEIQALMDDGFEVEKLLGFNEDELDSITQNIDIEEFMSDENVPEKDDSTEKGDETGNVTCPECGHTFSIDGE